MPISAKHVAKLANLQLPPEQLEQQQKALNSIMAYIEEIQDLDLAQVPLTARVIEEENILGEDAVEPSLTQAQALQNATKTHQGYFLVPAVLEHKDA